MGRPSLLTDEPREQLETALAAGAPVRIAAEGAGISQATLHSWISRSIVTRRPRLRLVDDDGRCRRTRFRKNREDLAALRVVVRRGFTHYLADLLVSDLERQLPRLEKQQGPVYDRATAAGFHY